MDVYHYTGIAGVVLYLTSYALLQFGYIRGTSYTYTFMNLAAASCVLISLIQDFNLSSALIQGSWISISVIGLTRTYLNEKRLRFSPSEAGMASALFPTMPKTDLRRFCNLGTWGDATDGAVLTRQGEPVPHLVYILTGQARVMVNGKRVATVTDHSFIGEMTCMTGDPATATVEIDGHAHCFFIPAEKLRKSLMTNALILEHLERAIGADLRRKLTSHGQPPDIKPKLIPC